eukprot:11872907-Karenia_brevis.AAC.1
MHDSFCPGKFGSIGIIVFKSSKFMWDFLMDNKGNRFVHNDLQLWHTIEKNKEERSLAKRASESNSLAQRMVEESRHRGRSQEGHR